MSDLTILAAGEMETNTHGLYLHGTSEAVAAMARALGLYQAFTVQLVDGGVMLRPAGDDGQELGGGAQA